MRKSILIFTAVLVAGAFAHAFADDMTSLDSGVETARAARLGAPSAPATPAAAQPNQSDARGGATQSTGGAQGLRALPVPATTPSTASGPARAPIAGRDTPGAPTDTGTSTREISNRAATVQPIARTAITPSTSDNRIISTRTSVTAGPDTGRATATVAPVSTDQTAQTRVAIAPVHGTGAAPTMPVVSRTSPNARATGDKPSAMGRSAIQLSRSAKKAAPIPDDQRDFTTCHDTYFQCMDEFCANKDAQLKRCACSSRVHDFDKQKKQ
ncbi:MAG: hypothetical protein FWC51_04490, partial [Proteobacteria bacterium]|nr:hypothetical protein [Pseudomonadota bacterium]